MNGPTLVVIPDLGALVVADQTPTSYLTTASILKPRKFRRIWASTANLE